MDFVFLAQEILDITAAKAAGGNIWENPLLAGFKTRLKEHYQAKQDDQCCYCRKNIHSEFAMVLDIEHVLPKATFAQFLFEVFNLSVSCKRCNMKVKRNNIQFITDLQAIINTPLDTNLYRLLHPHFDIYFDNLNIISIMVNKTLLIKYKVINGSQKGQYTYDFFKLFDLEIMRLDKAQGLTPTHLSESIDSQTSQEIIDLIEKLS